MEPEKKAAVQKAMQRILHDGLVSIRNHVRLDPEYAFVEADHLHNLPNYIADPSDDLLNYYFNTERPCYQNALKRVKRETLEFIPHLHQEAWTILRQQAK